MVIDCASAPEAAKTPNREARISLFILLIYSRATCKSVWFSSFCAGILSKQEARARNCESPRIMKPDTYSVTIVWSDEDDAFVDNVSELPGCMAHGESREQVIEQIKFAIENWPPPYRALVNPLPSPAADTVAAGF